VARRWTDAEVRRLFNGLGAFGVNFFQRGTLPPEGARGPQRRSGPAVYAKARRLYGHGGLTRGAHTLHGLATTTGYHRRQLNRARTALNQKWKRTSTHGAYLITDDQATDILEWLKHDYWVSSKRLYGCMWCATQTREHKGLGLCVRCYGQYRRLCQHYSIPSKISGQQALLHGISAHDAVNAKAHGPFMQDASDRLKRGVALDDWAIELLHLLQPTQEMR